jgi:hypothetical protein
MQLCYWAGIKVWSDTKLIAPGGFRSEQNLESRGAQSLEVRWFVETAIVKWKVKFRWLKRGGSRG